MLPQFNCGSVLVLFLTYIVFQNKRKYFLFISFLVIFRFILDLVINRNGYAIHEVSF